MPWRIPAIITCRISSQKFIFQKQVCRKFLTAQEFPLFFRLQGENLTFLCGKQHFSFPRHCSWMGWVAKLMSVQMKWMTERILHFKYTSYVLHKSRVADPVFLVMARIRFLFHIPLQNPSLLKLWCQYFLTWVVIKWY